VTVLADPRRPTEGAQNRIVPQTDGLHEAARAPERMKRRRHGSRRRAPCRHARPNRARRQFTPLALSRTLGDITPASAAGCS